MGTLSQKRYTRTPVTFFEPRHIFHTASDKKEVYSFGKQLGGASKSIYPFPVVEGATVDDELYLLRQTKLLSRLKRREGYIKLLHINAVARDKDFLCGHSILDIKSFEPLRNDDHTGNPVEQKFGEQ